MAFLDFLPLIGSAVGGLFGLGSQVSTNNAQMRLAQFAYDKNLEMWHKQNQYNSPKNQKARMIEAGFNPNLVYGNGSVVNTASNAPQYDAPHLGAYTNFGDLGAGQSYQLYMQGQQTRADIALKNAQVKGVLANARVSSLEVGVKLQEILSRQMDNAMKRKDLKSYNDFRDLQIDLMRANRDNIDSLTNYRDGVQTNLANAQIANYDEQNKTLKFNNQFMNPLRMKQAQVSIMNGLKDLAVKDQNIKESQSRILLNDATRSKIASEIVSISLKNNGQIQENQMNEILLKNGINLRESGWSGAVGKFCHVLGGYVDAATDWLGDLF
ncbi:DNA pilot protein [Dipodfec virus RodF1_81]|uniref:DNA pilot protein n=1 Tax=Dipodfec virus RodF1_81 TaxID=2929313 RepID=A0A976N2J4_9VIRU|nr:DNA pilot protein [Dipodfec virus RodF1_81]